MAGDSILTTTTIVSSIYQQASHVPPVNHGGWSAPDSLLTRLFAGEPKTIAIAFLVTLLLPILLHFYFYTTSSRSSTSGGAGDGVPTFLLLGPSGSGKTSLLTLLQRRVIALTSKDVAEEDVPEPATNGTNSHHVAASSTRLSQTATTIGMRLPPGTPLGSNKYRSENDFEVAASQKRGPKYKIVDTPGHGKLRLEQSLSYITRAGISLKGVIFMVDSGAMDTAAADGGDTAKDTVSYLHDVLLRLQNRPKTIKKTKAEDVKILIACNKQDLFTSLPSNAIKSRLEHELERLKSSKRKGISAVDAKDELDENEDETVLGGGGEGSFSFSLLENVFGVVVDVIGGAVKGDEDGKAVKKWEEWLGSCL